MKSFWSILAALSVGATFADTSWDFGAWRAEFRNADSKLELVHADSGARIYGVLAFVGPAEVTGAGVAAEDSDMAAWRVADSRDGVKGRLALVDTKDNVNGYVVLRGNGDRVSIQVYHRTAFAYQGALGFSGVVKYRDDAFACRTRPLGFDSVLQVKSGDADSLLDDSLFSRAADEALVFGSRADILRGTSIARVAGLWRLNFRLLIDEPTDGELTIAVEKDYFRSRWVPYYRPLDRARAPHAPTGWLSWNTYFDQAGSRENLDEARFAAKHFKPFGMEIWNIESWQDNSPKLPVSNFHNMNLETYRAQFPEGMKWLADEIRKLGFRPGLWMAPYGTGNDAFYSGHRDWFLHRADGTPVRSWNGKYTLDPTAPGALDHLTSIFDRASHDWGYEFFKIDGMSGRGHGYCAHLYERPEIRALMHDPKCPNPFERTVAAFRKGIGDDRIFLACQGHFTGAEAAYADCSRTGADIVHPNEPVKWENILLQSRCTVNQIFAHSIVFWSDPDCMLVSQGALAREQAQVEATVVALPGQQTFAGDRLAELAPDRVKLIQQALPVCDTHPAKLYPQFGRLPVWDLKVARPFGDWHVVALFNWDDVAKEIGVGFDELGEPAERDFLAWEFWTEKYLGVKSGLLAMEVPARSVRLVAMQPAKNRPQFLTSDRHLTQGAVGLEDERWDGKRLTLKVAAVGGFPQKVRIAVPEGWAAESATLDGAPLEVRQEFDGRVLAAEILVDSTRSVGLSVDFRRP